jgi:transposase
MYEKCSQVLTAALADTHHYPALATRMLRRGPNVAAVALANKNARVIWALLVRGDDYRTRAVA